MKKSFLFLSLSAILNSAGAQWQATAPLNCSSGMAGEVYLTSTGTTLFAATNDFCSAFLSSDNGGSWKQINNGLANINVHKIMVNGTSIFAATDDGVYLSSNNGSSWAAVNNGLTNKSAWALNVVGANIFAGTFGGGIFLSANNGSSWTAINSGLSNMNVLSLITAGTNIFAGTDGGVFLSTNNGGSWVAMNNGLTNTHILSLASAGSTIYAGTLGGGIFSSNDNGINWIAVNTGLTNKTVWAIAVDGGNIYAGTDWGIFLSTNNGISWTPVNTGLTNLQASSFAISGNNLYAGFYNRTVWKRPLSEFTKINVANTDSDLSIYPNPVSSQLTIHSSFHENQEAGISIYNLSGRMVKDIKIKWASNIKIDINSLDAGIYFLQIKTGSINSFKMFVKE